MKTNRIKVRLTRDGYAPCMVQLEIVNARLLARVKRNLLENGAPDEDTALLSEDDYNSFVDAGDISARAHRELEEGWPHTSCIMDRFTVLTCYGYDCNTL